jgi:hypothetical protein
MSQQYSGVIINTGAKPKGFVFTKPWVANLICIMAFFPFISLLPNMQAEVQPYCYIVAFLFMLLFRQKLPYLFYLFLFIVAAYFAYYLAASFHSDFGIAFQSVPHLIIFIGPPVFFWVMYKNFDKLHLHTLHIIFYIWVGVGFLQHLFPSVFAATGLKFLLEALIPRFSVESLAGWGDRGVTSLSNEPSYAGIILFALFTIVIYRWIKGEINGKTLSVNIFLYLVSLFFNASLTMFLLTLLLVLAIIYHTRKYMLSLVVLAGITILFLIAGINFRIFDLIILLPELLEASDWNPYYVMIGPLGSHREFSAYVGLKSGFTHLFGNGYYSSMTDFINVAKAINIDLSRSFFFDYTNNGYYLNMKPYGYGALVLFELGMIPFLLINSVLAGLILHAKKVKGKFQRFGLVLSIGILVLLNFNTPASLPTYWFALITALFIMTERSSGLDNDEKSCVE